MYIIYIFYNSYYLNKYLLFLVSHRTSSTSSTKATQNLSMAVPNSSSPPSVLTSDPSTSKQSDLVQQLQIQTDINLDIAAHLAAVVSNKTTSNGYSESHSKNSQMFSKHFQPSQRNLINLNENSQDKTTKGKQKPKSNNNGNQNSDSYGHYVRDLSNHNKDTTSKDALDFKKFAENLIRKNMSSVDSNMDENKKDESNTSNITLKSLLSNVNAQEIKFMERFQAENLGSEIEILKAKNRELQLSATEKDRQLHLYQKQVDILKNTLSKADQVNKEQARTIESLKQSLLKEMERYEDTEKRDLPQSKSSNIGLTLQNRTTYSNYVSEFGQDRYKEKRYPIKEERYSKVVSEEEMRDTSFAIYERGGVTITPVNCNISNKNPNGNYDMKEEMEYEGNGDRYNEELATIEPVIEMNCSDEEVAYGGDGEERIHGERLPSNETQEERQIKLEHGKDDVS